jgi:hypothetical protein
MAGSAVLKNGLIALALLALIAVGIPPIGPGHAQLRKAFASGLSAVGLCQPEWKLFAPNVHKHNCRIVAEVVLDDGSVRHWASPDFQQRSFLERLTQGQLPKFYDNLRRDRNQAAWSSFALWVAHEVAPDRKLRLIRLERRCSEVELPARASLPPRARRSELVSHVFYEARFQ